jgi:hypothetical protein
LEKTSFFKYFKAGFLFKLGKPEEAKKAVLEYAESDEGKKSPYFVALNYAAVNEFEQAFAWLEKSFAKREANLTSLKIEPSFDGLRDDPRYADLLRRINLAK